MDLKLAFVLGICFLVTVESRRQQKTCQEPQQSSGGSLNEMVGNLFPCNVEQDNQQQQADENEDEAVSESVSQPYSQDIRYDPKRSEQIAESVLDLSQRLTENILSQSTKKFEIMSPISVASALHLALLGAHGMTFNELMDLMEYNTKSFSQHPFRIHEEFGLLLDDLVSNTLDSSRYRSKVPWRAQAPKDYEKRAMKYQSNQPNYNEHKISVANGIFIQRDFSIRDEYKEVVVNIYRSELQSLDFRGDPKGSAKTINDWVNEKTNGKIKEIIPGNTSPETRVILANALYFNAEWQETFMEGATGFKKFYPNGKDSDYHVMVELMAHGGKFPHYYDPESDSEILGLPYKQNATTMYVILPRNSNAERLRSAQKILTADKIEKMISQMVIKTAVILFPKMHLSCAHHLKRHLRDLGLHTLFEPYQSDLSVMSEGNRMFTNNFQASQLPSVSPAQPTPFSFAPVPMNNPLTGNNNRVSHPLPRPFDPKETLIFGRMNTDDSVPTSKKTKRDVTYKVESQNSKRDSPLTLKDFMLRKRIVKKSQMKKLRRNKRQTMPFYVERLDMIRHRKDLLNPYLFAEEVIHKVDLTVNEKGTEGGAATAITLNRSGTQVVFRVDTPFMFLIRHDPTHVPLFYGVVFEPENLP